MIFIWFLTYLIDILRFSLTSNNLNFRQNFPTCKVSISLQLLEVKYLKKLAVYCFKA